MQVPLELTFRHVPRTDAMESLVREKAARLEKFCPDIIACRVAIERPQRHQNTGNIYRVRIEVTIPPHKNLIVHKEPGQEEMHLELGGVVRDAFHAMERQVREANERRQGQVKRHEEPVAFVARMFPEQGYGFIETPDGRDVYFHRNAVLHGEWDRLAVGTQVRFAESMGENGPQASSLHIIDKPGENPTEELMSGGAAESQREPR